MPAIPILLVLALVTAMAGTIGGIGGAIMLVPLLVLLGVDPKLAAPLGILTVAAGSLAAAPRQLREGIVHHRLGMTLNVTTSAGAIAGALFADAIPGSVLTRLLAVVAIAAALIGGRRKGMRNQPSATFAHESAGEWPGTLGGTYTLGDEMVPYQAIRVPTGIIASLGAGIISGLAGVGGGFIRTPTMSEVMHVPVKVAAATSTFIVGVTASASLIVFAGQDRIDVRAGAAVVLGGLLGGIGGSRLQERLHPKHVRQFLSAALVLIGLLLLVRG